MKYWIILLLGLFFHQVYAQPSVDPNWNTTNEFYEDFQADKTWNTNWVDQFNRWKAYVPYSVLHGINEIQVYRRESIFRNPYQNDLILRAEYAGGQIDPIITVPGITENPLDTFNFYHSGAIFTTRENFLYGYFEIRCKLPVNRGAFPAFWLWNKTGGNYREIDVFEYTWHLTTKINDLGNPRYFEGQIYYYNGVKPALETDYKYGNFAYIVPGSEPDLSGWHTYGLEWSPSLVRWYFDNQLIASYKGDSIPDQAMMMIVNHAIDSYSTPDSIPITYGFPSEMTIDYVKVNKLKCDCNNTASILNNTQLSSFNYQVYREITIGDNSSPITVPANSHLIFRATNEIEIAGEFTLPLGSSLEMLTHLCPE
jgi:hypothetical protein